MTHPFEHLLEDDIVLDGLPDEVVATMEQRDRWLSSLPIDAGGFEFLVSDTQAWSPGQTVTVAFNGGSRETHDRIVALTEQIAAVCNLTLDFGLDEDIGDYRSWSEDDTTRSADIRIAFDMRGYFSLVGTDSINPMIGLPDGAVGGRAHQRSLNLGGFDRFWPPNGERTVLHEILHALSFHHEHQNMRGPCDRSFRWDDDPDYELTRDGNGRFITDAAGRRPGIYTYLSGYPNFWTVAKIDHNLRVSNDEATVAGPFDRASVMLYRFPTLFYRTQPSPCAPKGDGLSLSEGDIRGLELLYPGRQEHVEHIFGRRKELLQKLPTPPAVAPGYEPEGGEPASFAEQTANAIQHSLELAT